MKAHGVHVHASIEWQLQQPMGWTRHAHSIVLDYNNGSLLIIVAAKVIELAASNAVYQASAVIVKLVRNEQTECIAIRSAISCYIERRVISVGPPLK